jgi:hypothetical protein
MLSRELFEAPLADFDVFGDQSTEGSFRADDLRAIRNPKWREKVFRAFDKTPFNFNIYVYNGPEGMAPVGRQYHDDDDKVQVNDLANIYKYAGLQSSAVIQKLIGKMPPDVANSITVVLVENEGSERVAFTPWILAHRVVHAIFYARQEDDTRGPGRGQNQQISQTGGDIFRTITNLLGTMEKRFEHSEHHGEKFRNLVKPLDRINRIATLIAKFKSGRNGKLASPGEFVIELVTQFLVTGHVTFNHPDMDNLGRTPPLDPNVDVTLLELARGYNTGYSNDVTDFVEAALRQKYRIKNPPRKPDFERESYTAFDESGQAIAAFGADRVEKYQKQGYRVTRNPPPTAQAVARYKTYIKRQQELTELFNQWKEAGLLRFANPTSTDTTDIILGNFEKKLNEQIVALLTVCVGKMLVL